MPISGGKLFIANANDYRVVIKLMMSQAVQGLQICPGDNGQFKCEWLEIE